MDGSKLKILIVEDVKIAQKMAMMAFAPYDCEIHTADIGGEAINLFNQYDYDLIFMDLGLPDMDGLTVTETIRKKEESLNTRTTIIALTAHISDEFRRGAYDAGMDDFISKPLTENKAQEMIDKYVKKRNFRNYFKTK